MDASGWKRLKDQERQTVMPPMLPERLNLRTAAAVLAEHSKATLSEAHLESLGAVTVTRDGIIRLRPSSGLLLRRGNEEYDAGELARVLGEVALTERALQDGTCLAGERPVALLLVENIGPYIDLRPPPGWLVAHVPGWNTATVKLLFEQLAEVPVVHFGDLDPNGLRIVQHLRELCPSLLWAVPDFWSEHIKCRARTCTWPEDLDLQAAPGWVRELATCGRWLEQELIALDPRLSGALEAIVGPANRRHAPPTQPSRAP
ncbi:Wadjet anti-phage system protein JetD domain-containing protein [Archangium sp.]|uniref:Wadjet anti-phage system protein JetD domain-containing protein n=1 Tax=Archangium sp. TaxID=1872627 RepID=UPI00286B1F7E|nr:Wadjet anti-phage system protein JetD domain-containing protein [Archangium sp.]